MVKHKPKYTAEAVAAWRAIGAQEKDQCIRNPDFLAGKFLGPKFWLITRVAPLVKLAMRFVPHILPGSYYFLTARTKHIDATLKQVIDQGVEQLVILGAGYDSRAYRFRDMLKEVRVFEVDLPETQARKKRKLINLLGSLPEWVEFIAMDFNTERLDSRLLESNYDPLRKSFFIWEGVCPYVSPEAVDQILSFVAHRSGAGSSIIFDYIYHSVVEGTCDYYGARTVARSVARHGEPYIFGIPEGTAAQFLAQRGYALVADFGPEKLESTYLIGENGKLSGRVLGYVSTAHAIVEHED